MLTHTSETCWCFHWQVLALLSFAESQVGQEVKFQMEFTVNKTSTIAFELRSFVDDQKTSSTFSLICLFFHFFIKFLGEGKNKRLLIGCHGKWLHEKDLDTTNAQKTWKVQWSIQQMCCCGISLCFGLLFDQQRFALTVQSAQLQSFVSPFGTIINLTNHVKLEHNRLHSHGAQGHFHAGFSKAHNVHSGFVCMQQMTSQRGCHLSVEFKLFDTPNHIVVAAEMTHTALLACIVFCVTDMRFGCDDRGVKVETAALLASFVVHNVQAANLAQPQHCRHTQKKNLQHVQLLMSLKACLLAKSVLEHAVETKCRVVWQLQVVSSVVVFLQLERTFQQKAMNQSIQPQQRRSRRRRKRIKAATRRIQCRSKRWREALFCRCRTSCG